ncbi:MAG: GNAT family N-acetyltransferase [Flavobacteriales bacterium]|nr:GNAT family N-acetyltransferase [Flavobacteriales bacterium]
MLRGERIGLREMVPSDLELLYKWENDRRHWHLSQTTRPYSREDIKAFIENVKDIYLDLQLRLMIELNLQSKAIGTLDIFDLDTLNKRAGLGILIAENEDRKRGFGFDSLEIVKVYAREVLNLHQLYANILKSNIESIALFEKAGFKKCGEKLEWVKRENGYENECMYQIIL